MGKRKAQNKAKKAKEQPVRDIYPDDYEVEYIVCVKPLPDSNGRRFEYLVHWAGYEEETWEPFEHLADCERLLMSLWRVLGAVDPRSTKVLKPPQKWIDSEIQFFKRMYTQSTCGTWHKQPAIGYNEETGELNRYD